MSYSPAINTEGTSGQAGLDDPPSTNSTVDTVSPSMEDSADYWKRLNAALDSHQWYYDLAVALFSEMPPAQTGSSNFTSGSNTSELASQQMDTATSPGPSQSR